MLEPQLSDNEYAIDVYAQPPKVAPAPAPHCPMQHVYHAVKMSRDGCN